MYVYIHVGWFQVNIMDMLYQEGKAAPPLFKNQPPVAGSIFWERSLFLRMKNTIIKFLTMDEMMLTERGKAVSISLTSSDWPINVPGKIWWLNLLGEPTKYVHYLLCAPHNKLIASFDIVNIVYIVLGSYRAIVTQVFCIYMYVCIRLSSWMGILSLI